MRVVPLVFGSFFALTAFTPPPAYAASQADRFSAGGYFRIMTRPDFQGGNSRLGYWNLYGRLLNEGPWGALELQLDLLERTPQSTAVWASVHTKIEGSSFANTDTENGWLGSYRVTQMYVQAGNVLFDHVTWQLGTLDTYMGDLGLYDMKPAQVLFDTVGLSGRYDHGPIELVLGTGDAGYFLRATGQGAASTLKTADLSHYSTILTAGGTLRVRLTGALEMGLGGQGYYEPKVAGNRFAPHDTPDLDYEDFLRGEVVQHYLDNHPGQAELFGRDDATRPVARASTSFKAVAYLGFGQLGPLKWNSLYASYLRRHPDSFVTESYQGSDYTLYVRSLTDERTDLLVGNEMQLVVWPERLDAVWACLYGHSLDGDNSLAPSDYNRDIASTVLRLQVYLSDTIHVLVESSLAREKSLNGRAFREHYDSMFYNSAGVVDTRGFEYGDTDTRTTWQGKGGLILNPLGKGIYNRPSLRFLYGLQHSNVHNAFSNRFAATLDQYTQFPDTNDRHWHSVVAIEAEAWF